MSNEGHDTGEAKPEDSTSPTSETNVEAVESGGKASAYVRAFREAKANPAPRDESAVAPRAAGGASAAQATTPAKPMSKGAWVVLILILMFIGGSIVQCTGGGASQA